MFPILAYSRIFCPSSVIFSFPFKVRSSFFFSSSSARRFCIAARVSSSGSTQMVPSDPSTMPSFPSTLSSSGSGVPTSAGIAMVLARIAVWEFKEPCTVTKERTLSLSICTVSDGARSSATMIAGSSFKDASVSSPFKMEIRRSEISLTSAARSLM